MHMHVAVAVVLAGLALTTPGGSAQADFVDTGSDGFYTLNAGPNTPSLKGNLPGKLDLTLPGDGNVVARVIGDFGSSSQPRLESISKQFTYSSTGTDPNNHEGTSFGGAMERYYYYVPSSPDDKLYIAAEHSATGFLAPGAKIFISYDASVGSGDHGVFADSWNQEISTPGAFVIPSVFKDEYLDHLYQYPGFRLSIGFTVQITESSNGQKSSITLDPGISMSSPAASIPEPGQLVLIGSAFGVVVLCRRLSSRLAKLRTIK